jgi:hypothetical protein
MFGSFATSFHVVKGCRLASSTTYLASFVPNPGTCFTTSAERVVFKLGRRGGECERLDAGDSGSTFTFTVRGCARSLVGERGSSLTGFCTSSPLDRATKCKSISAPAASSEIEKDKDAMVVKSPGAQRWRRITTGGAGALRPGRTGLSKNGAAEDHYGYAHDMVWECCHSEIRNYEQ